MRAVNSAQPRARFRLVTYLPVHMPAATRRQPQCSWLLGQDAPFVVAWCDTVLRLVTVDRVDVIQARVR